MSFKIFIVALRVGLTPTFSKVILESGANIAATMKYAAEEKSPGIFISQPISRFAFSIVI